MFTGIVLERGRLLTAPVPSVHGGHRLTIGHSGRLAERLTIGASLAVAGVCLTVTELESGSGTGGDDRGGDGDGDAGARSTVEISPETLSRTTLGRLAAGAAVNLEPALRVGDALGGHWVQGHADGVIALRDRTDHGDHVGFDFDLPEPFAPYLVEKGSVALDGVSLTVAWRGSDRFGVAVIPHTLAVTTLEGLVPGAPVNLEVDILAKHVEQLLARRGSPAG